MSDPLELEFRGPAYRLAVGLTDGESLPREILIDGPAGTGKTFSILVAIHIWLWNTPGARALLCRAHRASLSESVLVTYEQDVLPLFGHEFLSEGAGRHNRQAYVYPSGAEAICAGLDKASKVLSSPYDVVFINEANELPVAEQWETLLSRQKRPGRKTKRGLLLADCNPGDPSHWLKKRCDSGLCELWSSRHRHNPALHDGTDWTEAGRAYLEQLGALTGTRRRRLLEGLWVAGEGGWFEAFDATRHVTAAAEFAPGKGPVYLAVDTGYHTGAVWFQAIETPTGARVNVFADHYHAGNGPTARAQEIRAITAERCGRFDVGMVDPAAGASTGHDSTILAEFAAAGLRIRPWLKFPGCVSSGLNLLSTLLEGDPPGLTIHPRCERLIAALGSYKRKRRGGQWVDEPEDPQHPHEDLIDPLRSALLDRFPDGRRSARPRFPLATPHRFT